MTMRWLPQFTRCSPAGAEATEIALGPLCTMVAQPLIGLHVPNVASKNIRFNMLPPNFGLVLNSKQLCSPTKNSIGMPIGCCEA
jgi:hypothetical protein